MASRSSEKTPARPPARTGGYQTGRNRGSYPPQRKRELRDPEMSAYLMSDPSSGRPSASRRKPPAARQNPPVPRQRPPVSRQEPRQRRPERRPPKRGKTVVTVILLLVLVAAVGGTAAYFLLQRSGTLVTYAEPFSSAREFRSAVTERENLMAQSFADNLCVFEGDVACEGVTLPADQKGLLLDVNQHRTLYAKDAFSRVYPASITKLVTAIMALTYGNMTDAVTIRQEDLDLEENAQVCGFLPGDVLTMDQLLHCLLVYSGNDAAMAIADHIGGSIEGFVDMMNEYARSLGCTGTHFVNPHGLHDDNHYTTPYDIYLILKEAAKYPEFTTISQMPSYTVEYDRPDGTHMRTLLEATDHYLTGEAVLPKNVTILGGKTGTTSLAGNCLALLTQNAYGRPFVSIVMGAQTKDLLYEQMNSLLLKIND